jgi:hypothetical protein
MSEERAPYQITAAPLQVIPGTPEARLVEKYRQARQMWAGHRRKIIIVLDEQGNVDLFDAKPAGHILP